MWLAIIICGLCIGMVLALFGSGGSILALPALIYVFAIKPTVASSYSLFIVAVTCLVGFVLGQKKNKLNVSKAFAIALPSSLSTYLVRHYLLQEIPETIIDFELIKLSKDFLLKAIIAIMMLISGFRMAFRNHVERGDATSIKEVYPKYFAVAFLIGCLTGLVGSGGGFLIVPAMVSILGFSMRYATKISLLIICINSSVGIVGDYKLLPSLNWLFLGKFVLSSLLGLYIGNKLASKLKDHHQKRAFGYFLIMVSLSIILRELVKL
ncbi:MAG: sulfite exporter TauE/SafE family protein [Alphaproteobacteria bacterium]|nr:sulfite exporter TauE/SafE family protein [Alphaproteobacteria bacterium]OJV13698.1 MAG: hypothetical protein BGO27_00815 [Alphaproteobacteria bacterium 33-17]